MLWSTYEAEKNFEQRSHELNRQWKLLQGETGKERKSGKLLRIGRKRQAKTEPCDVPRTLGCSCSPVAP